LSIKKPKLFHQNLGFFAFCLLPFALILVFPNQYIGNFHRLGAYQDFSIGRQAHLVNLVRIIEENEILDSIS
jgi:hypothetical protein